MSTRWRVIYAEKPSPQAQAVAALDKPTKATLEAALRSAGLEPTEFKNNATRIAALRDFLKADEPNDGAAPL